MSLPAPEGPPQGLPPILAGAGELLTGTAVFFCLPLFVGAAADSLGLDPRQQGLLAAMDVSGSALAGLSSLPWIERWSCWCWPRSRSIWSRPWSSAGASRASSTN